VTMPRFRRVLADVRAPTRTQAVSRLSRAALRARFFRRARSRRRKSGGPKGEADLLRGYINYFGIYLLIDEKGEVHVRRAGAIR
jgi:hypothetical protein